MLIGDWLVRQWDFPIAQGDLRLQALGGHFPRCPCSRKEDSGRGALSTADRTLSLLASGERGWHSTQLTSTGTGLGRRGLGRKSPTFCFHQDISFCRKSPAVGGKMLVYQEQSHIPQVPSYLSSLALLKHPGCGNDLPDLR